MTASGRCFVSGISTGICIVRTLAVNVPSSSGCSTPISETVPGLGIHVRPVCVFDKVLFSTSDCRTNSMEKHQHAGCTLTEYDFSTRTECDSSRSSGGSTLVLHPDDVAQSVPAVRPLNQR